ncbi:hypothetical protein TNCV_2007121 [Trichonephila clavipes]|nr:hypothetical protein TNCV_2007121 [Trichonephila clavipes]
MEESSRSGLSMNKIIVRIFSTVKCCFWLYSPKNWKFWTLWQLAAWDHHHPCIIIGLPPCTMNTHLVKRWQSVEAGLCDWPQEVLRRPCSWLACHEFEPNTAEDPPCRDAMHVKSVEAQTSSCWCGVKVRRKGYQLRSRPRH